MLGGILVETKESQIGLIACRETGTVWTNVKLQISKDIGASPGCCSVHSRSEKLAAFKLLVTGLLEAINLMKLTTT